MYGVMVLLLFLAIYYKIQWHLEMSDNDKLQDQKKKLYRRTQKYRAFIRKNDPVVTDLKIETIENGNKIH